MESAVMYGLTQYEAILCGWDTLQECKSEKSDSKMCINMRCLGGSVG